MLQKINNYENIEKRHFNVENDIKFSNLMANEKFEEAMVFEDATEKFEKFHEIYNRHYNEAYPIEKSRPKRKNQRRASKPWILPWLEDAIARKQNLYHIFVKRPTDANKQSYKKTCKILR